MPSPFTPPCQQCSFYFPRIHTSLSYSFGAEEFAAPYRGSHLVFPRPPGSFASLGEVVSLFFDRLLFDIDLFSPMTGLFFGSPTG